MRHSVLKHTNQKVWTVHVCHPSGNMSAIASRTFPGAPSVKAAKLYPEDIECYILHLGQVIEEIYRKCGLIESV